MDLNRTVKHLMVDAGIFGRGSVKILADRIGVSQQSLSMALTGYRKSKSYTAMLEKVKKHLEKQTSP